MEESGRDELTHHTPVLSERMVWKTYGAADYPPFSTFAGLFYGVHWYIGMPLLRNYHHEDRPWGSFDRFTLNEPSTVKILHVLPGLEFSLQRHEERSECWRVIAGSGTAYISDEERAVGIGDEIDIPVGTLHRLKGGPEGISVLEISFGKFEEDDIERIKDDFGRV